MPDVLYKMRYANLLFKIVLSQAEWQQVLTMWIESITDNCTSMITFNINIGDRHKENMVRSGLSEGQADR